MNGYQNREVAQAVVEIGYQAVISPCSQIAPLYRTYFCLVQFPSFAGTQ